MTNVNVPVRFGLTLHFRWAVVQFGMTSLAHPHRAKAAKQRHRAARLEPDAPSSHYWWTGNLHQATRHSLRNCSFSLRLGEDRGHRRTCTCRWLSTKWADISGVQLDGQKVKVRCSNWFSVLFSTGSEKVFTATLMTFLLDTVEYYKVLKAFLVIQCVRICGIRSGLCSVSAAEQCFFVPISVFSLPSETHFILENCDN